VEHRLRRYGAVFIIPAIYLLLALATTFPFVVHPQQTLTAPLLGDVAGSVAKYQTLIREEGNPFAGPHLVTIGYPYGVSIPAGVDRIAFPYVAFMWGASLLLGPVAAHGLLTVLGYTLTAVITFLFVRRVTGSNGAGLVAGLAYGFWPHMYLIAAAAPAYMHMWMFILPLWAWFELAMAPTPPRGLIAGVAALPAIFWTPYYLLHVSVIIGACLTVVVVRALVLRQAGGRRLASVGVALAVPLLAVAASTVVLGLSGHSGVPTRALEDAFQESAHPLMYLLPGHGSIWGPAPYQLLVRLVPRAEYVNSYLGISVIVLALVALAAAFRDWLRGRTAALTSPTVVATLLAGAVAVSCFLFSLPPHLAGNRIPMPDALVIAVQPAFRAGQRFVMPLMGGMAVLAGLGSSAILRRIRWPQLVPLVAVGLALVVGLDLFARHYDGYTGRPDSVTAIPQLPALAALANEPYGATFEFVNRGRINIMSGINPCLLQPQHGKTLVDTCGLVSQSPEFSSWDARRSCDTLAEMRIAGVRYVIVDATLHDILSCFSGPLAGKADKIASDQLVAVYRLN
jgi:hypothetical protein